MLVVADNSPVRSLRLLDCEQVLPVLFGRLLIPLAVLRELQHPHTPAVVQTWMAAPPAWLELRPIVGQPDAALAVLEVGEQEAIVLAQELQADILLVDDGKARDLIALLDDLKARGVAFRSLTESIDTATPTGRAMWQMIGILAELERSLLQERTQAGRAAAQARGVKMGRRPLLTAQQVAHARKLREQGESPAQVAQLLKVSRRTLYRALQG